jgi:hypothetical protein
MTAPEPRGAAGFADRGFRTAPDGDDRVEWHYMVCPCQSPVGGRRARKPGEGTVMRLPRSGAIVPCGSCLRGWSFDFAKDREGYTVEELLRQSCLAKEFRAMCDADEADTP